MKKKLTLYVEEAVIKRAKFQGLNISQFLETQLLRAIPVLELNNSLVQCPQCGVFTTDVSGKTRDDPDNPALSQSQTVCPQCGHKWWTYL